MGKVIAFSTDRPSDQPACEDPIVEATLNLLANNAALAVAIKKAMSRVFQLETLASKVESGTQIRPIDKLLEQDRERLALAMGQVLDAIQEHASGTRAKMKEVLK